MNDEYFLCTNWVLVMMLTKHCLTVCLKTTLSPSIVILPEVKTSSLHLRQKSHVFDLPS